ncbi:MAG TPA: hypothetical protein VFK52_01895 [Nocardioidaceae bacterium]|nr:hypothetical protein [Nocardioidaceae bacterium]
MKVPVLVTAGGAGWEARALEAIADSGNRLVLLKRCLDLSDLLASAATGSASVAVVGADVVGLDSDAVRALKRDGVSVVVVHDQHDSERLTRLGVDHHVEASSLALLADVLEGAAPQHLAFVEPPAAPTYGGQLVAVWGPAGAPGRTTVAAGIAAELAHRQEGTLLLDADPCGGALAQHLGVLDQVSGLLASARLANGGELDAVRLAGCARALGKHLRVLTGLPRADRWVEVRPAAFEELMTTAVTLEPNVVVDTGFCLEQDSGAGAGRHAMTLSALGRADQVVVVGAADPVGLTRLVRGLHDLGEVTDRVPVVVVNRMRSTLGWSEGDIAATIHGVRPDARVTFLPEDRLAVDRALMAGRSLVESGDSPLRRAVAGLADSLALVRS